MTDNKNFWIGVIVITLLVVVSLIGFGGALQDKDMLDNSSKTYLGNMTAKYNSSGMKETADSTDLIQREANPFISALQNVPILSDVLGLTNFLIDVTSGIWNFFKILYNIPSFMAYGLGLPEGAFQTQINIIGSLIGIATLVILIGLVK